MQIGAAIEAMKIIAPYVKHIKKETDSLNLIRVLVNQMQERQPTDSVRLVSLMFGITLEEVVNMLKDSKRGGLLRALVEGFTANPLPDLVNAGNMIGLIEERWTDARQPD